MRQQPHAPIFMTEPTAQIGDALLHNSVNVMTRQREEVGVGVYPLYTHGETGRATDLWRRIPVRQPFTLAGERSRPEEKGEINFEFWRAGHVLGAAGVLLRIEGRTRFLYRRCEFRRSIVDQRRGLSRARRSTCSSSRRRAAIRRCRRASARAAEEERFAGRTQSRLCTRRLRARARFRARQDAGNPDDALSIQAGADNRGRADLHRRV